MDVGVLLPSHYESSVGDFAEEAERLGYSSFWTSELWGSDALIELGVAAERTERIKLGTAIVNVFSRTPATLAMSASTIASLSGGRMVLGLGISTPRAIEGIHGLSFDRPLRRTREVVEVVKSLTSGSESVSYDGALISVDNIPPLGREIPIYNAALGPKSRRLTGEFCDGWVPHNIPYPKLESAFDGVVQGATDAGRDPDDIVVSPHLPTAVSEDRERVRGLLRGHIAYYVGSGKGYERAVAMAFPGESRAIASAWAAGDRDKARSLVTDEMIDTIGLAETPDAAIERIDEIESMEFVDEIRIVTPAGTPPDIVNETVNALAPKSY